MYGDGLFETIAVQGGEPCLWPQHMDRLGSGARRLGIPCPEPDLLYRECLESSAGMETCVVKLVLTRGSGGRGYRPPDRPEPSRILAQFPWPEHPPEWAENGIRARFCRTILGENSALAGIKHLNRLEQVLARAEWQDPDIAEGLMCDGRGRVIGGTMTNLFALIGGRILTPRIDTCGITGTARALTLQLAAQQGIEVAEADLTRQDLAGAEGVFLTNALIGAWAVTRLETIRLDPARLPWRLIGEVRSQALGPGPEVSR